MKKALAVVCCFSMAVIIAHPALAGIPAQSIRDHKINELSSRLAALESSWGRFQIGGSFELDTTTTQNKGQPSFSAPDFNQQSDLYLNSAVDQNLQFSINVSQLGSWGLKPQNVNSGNSLSPMTSPFQVDQIYLKLSQPDTVDYLGRFQFSLGPLGMMADFYANPVEGIAIQKAFKHFHVAGIYSRVNTIYRPDTDQIDTVQNYLAARIGWSNHSSIIGLNLIPGLSGETDFSIDYSNSQPNSKFAAEAGWYSFSSKTFPDYKVDWTPGALVSYGRMVTKTSYLQIKAGYFGSQFMPLYSSLAHSSGETREWFIPNSAGAEVYLQNWFKNGFGLENRLIYLVPITNYNQPDSDYRWRSCVVKHFSPVNELQVGFDLKSFPDNDYQQLFISWMLQF